MYDYSSNEFFITGVEGESEKTYKFLETITRVFKHTEGNYYKFYF